MHRTLLIALAACSAPPRATPVALPAPVSTNAAVPTVPDGSLVVAEVVQRVDECSGLGGEHYVLRLHDGTRRTVHAGGHGARLDLIPFGSTARAFVVAEIDLAPITFGDSGWCLNALPRHFDGRVHRIVRAADLREARAFLLQLVKDGGLDPDEERLSRTTRVVEPFCATNVCWSEHLRP